MQMLDSLVKITTQDRIVFEHPKYFPIGNECKKVFPEYNTRSWQIQIKNIFPAQNLISTNTKSI